MQALATAAGVHRYRLDRIGGEVARATSRVRYAPGSRFARHVHGGGEEFLALEGRFCDEQSEYPTGTWLRNPRWSQHTPFTGSEGALIDLKVEHLGARFLEPRAEGWWLKHLATLRSLRWRSRTAVTVMTRGFQRLAQGARAVMQAARVSALWAPGQTAGLASGVLSS